MQLEAKKVSFHYQKKQAWVLRDLDFCVRQGECVGLLAPSGYGKTTLAMLLAGYLAPSEGAILLDGRPLPQKGVCPVQLISQHPERAINPRWRLRKVLAESGQIQEDMLDSFGIEKEWLERFARELSG
ncbi:MAG: ATP-binding cassette domain-containing protein, partial [Lachnospiraceae bacterium]|nr:ATP-binding cassette domain-containing protein [Lachnospiraceae bacterium]